MSPASNSVYNKSIEDAMWDLGAAPMDTKRWPPPRVWHGTLHSCGT